MEDELFTFEAQYHGKLSVTEGRYLYSGGEAAFYDDFSSDFINLWGNAKLGVDLGVLELMSTGMDVVRMVASGINKERVCKLSFHDGNPIVFQALDYGPDMEGSLSRHVDKVTEELAIVSTFDSQDQSYFFDKDT